MALLWREKDTVRLLNIWRNFIDVSVHWQQMPSWRLTGFYGSPEPRRRKETWLKLQWLKGRNDFPRLCIGYFNEIRSGCFKTLNACDLNEVSMLGYPFTWKRSRGPDDWIEEKLDRGSKPSWAKLLPVN